MGERFARWYDFFMNPLEKGKFKTIRRDLLKHAEGSVLEIGSGTGINFPFYHSVERVTAIEPSQHMIQRSSEKQRMAKVPIEVIKESAEKLPFPNDSFDTIIVTLVLCTIPNPEDAIQEMKRVCKPDGKILIFEHIQMDNSILAKLQDWLTPVWKKVCDGCCLNRNTVQTLEENGLEIIHQKSFFNGLFVQLEAREQNHT